MGITRNRLVGLAVAGAVAVLLALVLRPKAVRVEVGSADIGSLVVTVDEEGRTRVRDRFVVAAPIAGRLARVTLKAGDPIEAGAVVARMNPLPLDPRTRAELAARLQAAEAAQREADARVAQARAALEQAQRTGGRARTLGSRGTIATEERELAELEETVRARELDADVFAAHAAAFNVEAARAALLAPGSEPARGLVGACESGAPDCLELRSPITGSVLRVLEESERVVVVGTPVVELGDTAALEVVVDVLSADAVRVRPGARMRIEEWGGSGPLEARVRLVEPSGFTKLSALGVEEQRVNIVADFVDGAAPVADGYRVEARIVVEEVHDAVKVPTSALFRRAGRWHVFVVVDGRARRRPVEIGARTPLEAEVRAGLRPGERVVLHPSDQVDEGVRVAPL